MIKFYEYEDELVEVAKIHVDNQRETYAGRLSQSYLESLSYEKVLEEWREWVRRKDRELLLYMVDDAVAGFASVRFFEKSPGCGMLSYLHVRKDMQHRGIGKYLISACAGLLYNMGIKSMQVTVIEGNHRAESLYRLYGAEFMPQLTHDYHKRYGWKDISNIADLSILPRYSYDYESIKTVRGKEIILFGAGKYSECFIKQFPECVPIKIFDNDSHKHGTYQNGCKIEAPQRANNVVIAFSFYDEIESQLKNLQCQNIVRFYPWHDYNKAKWE